MAGHRRSPAPPTSPSPLADAPPSGSYRRKLQAAKANSLGQVLLKCARLLDEQAVAQVRAARWGMPTLRPAHTRLLPHLDLDGTRLTELARRLQVSKQAAGQLVEEMTEMGVLERAEDPSDGRARLVRFTPFGRRGLLHGLQVLATIEADLTATVGARDLRTLHALLLRVQEALEARAARAPAAP